MATFNRNVEIGWKEKDYGKEACSSNRIRHGFAVR